MKPAVEMETIIEPAKTPHVRIEFDDVRDVPKVYIDGVDITDMKHSHKGLTKLHLDWETDLDVKMPKSYDIEFLDMDTGIRNGYAQYAKRS